MKNLGWIRQQVIDWIEDDSDRQAIDRAINVSIDVLTSKCTFSQLMSQVTVTPESDGTIITPPRCADIVEIYPANDNEEADFVFTGTKRVQSIGRRSGYFYRSKGVTEEPLHELICDLSNKSKWVTQNDSSTVSMSADMIGEEFVIAGGNETYRIDDFDGTGAKNKIKVYPEYRWADVTGVDCFVRPECTESIVLYNSLGDIYTGDVTIEFKQAHPYLVSDRDILQIPAFNTTALETVRFFLRQTKYDVDADRLERQYLEYFASECSKQPAKNEANFRANDGLFQTPGRGRNAFRRS